MSAAPKFTPTVSQAVHDASLTFGMARANKLCSGGRVA